MSRGDAKEEEELIDVENIDASDLSPPARKMMKTDIESSEDQRSHMVVNTEEPDNYDPLVHVGALDDLLESGDAPDEHDRFTPDTDTAAIVEHDSSNSEKPIEFVGDDFGDVLKDVENVAADKSNEPDIGQKLMEGSTTEKTVAEAAGQQISPLAAPEGPESSQGVKTPSHSKADRVGVLRRRMATTSPSDNLMSPVTIKLRRLYHTRARSRLAKFSSLFDEEHGEAADIPGQDSAEMDSAAGDGKCDTVGSDEPNVGGKVEAVEPGEANVGEDGDDNGVGGDGDAGATVEGNVGEEGPDHGEE